MFDTPILYLVFNRPYETSQSFEILRKLRPSKLYVAADGPRIQRQDDITNTKKVRKIVTGIDWPCEVKTLFRNENLGCRRALESSLDWFFEFEEDGIILEDDILPNEAFFNYCTLMLDKYRQNLNIFSINGCSVGFQSPTSYGLTRYFNMWGWATWKRSHDLVKTSWNSFNPGIELEKDISIKSGLHLPVTNASNKKWLIYWVNLFKAVYQGNVDTWDYQWMYTALKNNLFCIRPSENYVINIGFGEMATHHKFTKSPICNLRYTSASYSYSKIFNPKVDYRYEINYVGNIVNDNNLLTWKDSAKEILPHFIRKKIGLTIDKFKKNKFK